MSTLTSFASWAALLCFLSSTAVAAVPDQREDAGLQSLQARVDAAVLRLGWAAPLRLEKVAVGDARDGLVTDTILYISEPTLQISANARERDALIVVLAAGLPQPDGDTKPHVEEQLIALGVAAAASSLDPPSDRLNPKPILGEPRKDVLLDTGDQRLAARVIADTERVGSCTGPLATVLRKLAESGGVPNRLRAKAAMIQRGSGAAFYPPNFGCAG
jgi:hypothetical protein